MLRWTRRLVFAFILGLICGAVLIKMIPVHPPKAYLLREQLIKVAKLTTVEYRFEQLIVLDDHISVGLLGKQMNLPGTNKKVSILVVGKIKAGIDLERLEEDAITVNHKRVEIGLPETEIFGVEVDYKETRVFDERTGLFRRILDSDGVDFANLIIEKGCEEGKERAIEDGILVLGKENGKQILAQILSRLGFQEIEYK